jgi:hypothetical protein
MTAPESQLYRLAIDRHLAVFSFNAVLCLWEKDAADLFGFSVDDFRARRDRWGDGPDPKRIGKRWAYTLPALAAWDAQRSR